MLEREERGRAGQGKQRYLRALAKVRQMRSCAFPALAAGPSAVLEPPPVPSLAACARPRSSRMRARDRTGS
jgi:hypothetical protein